MITTPEKFELELNGVKMIVQELDFMSRRGLRPDEFPKSKMNMRDPVGIHTFNIKNFRLLSNCVLPI
jgi:hypothetical protein